MSPRSATIVSLLLIAASGAAYLPSLSGAYIYDDVRFVSENAAVMRGVPLLDYFTDPSTQTANASWQGLYRPLRTISFRVAAAFGEGPGPQRVVNLLLHLLNTALVWLLLLEIIGGGRKWPALVGALAFSLHPLASESVAWISSRGDLLAVTGMLAALLLYRRQSLWLRIASVLLFLSALLAKESAVVLPLLLVLVDGFEGGGQRVLRRLKHYVPYLVVLVAFVGVRYVVLAGAFDQGAVPQGTFLDRVSIVLVGWVYYVYTSLWPTGLSFELRILTGPGARVLAILGLALLFGLLALAYVLRCRAPRVTLAILWFVVALLPMTALQLFFPLKIAVANRFAYPAMVGLALLLALVTTRGRVTAVLAVITLLAFFPVTLARARVWSSPEALWTDVIEKDPDNAVGRFDLGRLMLDAGRPEEARTHLVRSVQIDPRHPQVHALIGETFEQLAQAQPEHSKQYRNYLAEAYNAYSAAVRMWQGGSREDTSLYGMTLVNTAYLAGVHGLVNLAREHGRELVNARPPVPGVGPVRDRLVNRLLQLSHYIQATKDPELAKALRAAAEQLRDGTQ